MKGSKHVELETKKIFWTSTSSGYARNESQVKMNQQYLALYNYFWVFKQRASWTHRKKSVCFWVADARQCHALETQNYSETLTCNSSGYAKNEREICKKWHISFSTWKGCFALRWIHRSLVQTLSYSRRLNYEMPNTYNRQRTISSERKCKECNVKNAQRRELAAAAALQKHTNTEESKTTCVVTHRRCRYCIE